jgi:hypothetical protein
MRPILRPGAPRIYRALSSSTPSAGSAGVVLSAMVGLLFASIGVGLVSPVAAIALIVLAVGGVAAGMVRAARHVVAGPSWTFEGRPIDGQGFQLLADIDSRFAYAESNIEKLPTGISWSEVGEDVRALLWEAAEHGAALTALDAEIHELRYAEPGTPQAALQHSLEAQRTAHWGVMRGIQWEAESLARVAGNAVAAAHVALARTGSLAALEQITPSRRAVVAAGALAEARSRLELLAGVWAELDESGTLVAEKLDAERRLQPGDGT